MWRLGKWPQVYCPGKRMACRGSKTVYLERRPKWLTWNLSTSDIRISRLTKPTCRRPFGKPDMNKITLRILQIFQRPWHKKSLWICQRQCKSVQFTMTGNSFEHSTIVLHHYLSLLKMFSPIVVISTHMGRQCICLRNSVSLVIQFSTSLRWR